MRVLVTRPLTEAGPLVRGLEDLGHTPVVVPLLELRFRVASVAAAAAEHPRADVLLVTSPTAADAVGVAAPGAWRTARVAAVGPATAQRLRALGYAVSVMPDRALGAELVRALGDLAGSTLVHPRADLAADGTATALRAQGATVVDVVAYENAAPADHVARLLAALPVDVTTLFSGSAADRLAAAVPPDRRDGLGQLVVVGPSTAAAAAAAGLDVHGVAEPHTATGVLTLLAKQLRRGG